jgi:hypothetical protein
MALAYLLSTWGWVRRWAASASAAPLALIGRHALPVFALGSLLALSAQAIKSAVPPSLLLDTALILGGLGLQYAMAVMRDRLSLKGK